MVLIFQVAIGVLIGGLLLFTFEKWFPVFLRGGLVVLVLGILLAVLVFVYFIGDAFFSSLSAQDKKAVLLIVAIIFFFRGGEYFIDRYNLGIGPALLFCWAVPPFFSSIVIKQYSEHLGFLSILLLSIISLGYLYIFVVWVRDCHRRRNESQHDKTWSDDAS